MGGKRDKAVHRLKSIPNDYTFTEAKSLLNSLGFSLFQKGKTSGSRVRFYKEGLIIDLHKPHPGDVMKRYAVKDLKEFLEEHKEI